MNQVYLFYMNDLQKKFAIVGSTAFIVWFSMAIANKGIEELIKGDFQDFFQNSVYYSMDCGVCANWLNALTFAIWVGSLIAYNIYKEDK